MKTQSKNVATTFKYLNRQQKEVENENRRKQKQSERYKDESTVKNNFRRYQAELEVEDMKRQI